MITIIEKVTIGAIDVVLERLDCDDKELNVTWFLNYRVLIRYTKTGKTLKAFGPYYKLPEAKTHWDQLAG